MKQLFLSSPKKRGWCGRVFASKAHCVSQHTLVDISLASSQPPVSSRGFILGLLSDTNGENSFHKGELHAGEDPKSGK